VLPTWWVFCAVAENANAMHIKTKNFFIMMVKIAVGWLNDKFLTIDPFIYAHLI
jgi:hypothetical protein